MPVDTSSDAQIAQEITAQLEAFSDKESRAKQKLTRLLASSPRGFVAAAVPVLAAVKQSPGVRYLVNLLTQEKMLPSSLLDAKISISVAAAALRTVAESGANLQPMLELALNRALQDHASHETSERILRLLELLSQIAPPALWNSFQLELMAHPDKLVRSKATLLIGRSTKNVAWLGRRFLDRDPRVQASAVEALWDVDPAESKALLWTASKSGYNRVVANALLGLYRIGEASAAQLLMDMARHPDPLFQASAYWAIAETGDASFLPFLSEQFKAASGKIRLAITRALACIRRRPMSPPAGSQPHEQMEAGAPANQ